MTNEQKKELIINNPVKAFYKLINSDNYTDYMTELSGCHSTKQHLIAVKYVLLQMLRKNLL